MDGIAGVERVGRDGDAVVLELDGVWADGDRGNPAVEGVSLQLREGEIVALAGVAGNGQRELAETITGLRAPTAGSVTIDGRRLRGGGPGLAARDGSGGTHPQVVLAGEVSGAPRVRGGPTPTRGLDVSAIETVHTYLLEAAERGVAVLLISEDLDEILALADRVVVMFDGRLAESPSRDVEEIGLLMAGEGVPAAD
jgi:ABC-type uncharacterized transport system ATPase subunit